MAERPSRFDGTMTVTWPRPRGGAVPAWAVSLADAATGEAITTVTGFTTRIHAVAGDVVWAEVTMFADGDGRPLLSGRPVLAPLADRDAVKTGTFAFLVTEMRVAPEPAMDDEPGPSCAGGCGSRQQVVWCSAWTAWLCPDCRDQRGERELKPTGLLLGLRDA